jgi:hypothetical protein
MRDVGHCYEYVCSYVDDLTAIMVDLQAFFDELKCCGFGLKGVTANPEVFLGGSFGGVQMAPCFGALSVLLHGLWRHTKG